MADANEPAESYRCWICLDDAATLDDMISPCACVGTNKWVHSDCIKTYCLQHLANHEPSSRQLKVACPICKTDYRIVEQRSTSTAVMSSMAERWREFSDWSTDWHLLLRHLRYLLLIAPLIGSSAIAWYYLFGFWHELYTEGPGAPLMLQDDIKSDAVFTKGVAGWVEAVAPGAWDGHVTTLLNFLASHLGIEVSAEAAASQTPDGMPTPVAAQPTGGAIYIQPELNKEQTLHPAGISRRWSLLYVWLQYVQWYKILCWLVTMVVGGAEGVLPESLREVFRVDELLLASEFRANVFLIGQCVPFVVTKIRHFVVTWARASRPIQFLFYSLFTSHVEVASNLCCDSACTALLFYDWISSASKDLELRRNMNRLRLGDFIVAPFQPASAGKAKNAGGLRKRQVTR